jgi:hypothetical protein
MMISSLIVIIVGLFLMGISFYIKIGGSENVKL